VLLGVSNAMRALRYLPIRRAYWHRAALPASSSPGALLDAGKGDFLSARQALAAYGIPIVDAASANSADEAVALQHRFGSPVALKVEAPGLLHKSDIGAVRLGLKDKTAVASAYREVIENAHKAGFRSVTQVLVQPMVSGVAEAYAGVINDPLFGPAVCFGLGGIFIEVMADARTEMAPLTRDDALAMINGVKGAQILKGARGRPAGDIDALADLLVKLGHFAAANAGQFRALDLNPIIVKAANEGVVAVDIAVEPLQEETAGATRVGS
jgi:acetate---CoA ligase (ADP-forming)